MSFVLGTFFLIERQFGIPQVVRHLLSCFIQRGLKSFLQLPSVLPEGYSVFMQVIVLQGLLVEQVLEVVRLLLERVDEVCRQTLTLTGVCLLDLVPELLSVIIRLSLHRVLILLKTVYFLQKLVGILLFLAKFYPQLLQ